MAEKSESEKRNIFRPLGESDTSQFLNYYKDLFLQSNTCSGAESADFYEKIKNLSPSDNRIDPNCVVKIKNRLVRIEYPGEVQNVEKAIDTLGGMASIETSVADPRKKLELRFHPDNQFTKPCIADRDFKPGILLKVKKSLLQPQPGCSKDTSQTNLDYQVEGVSVMNFSFNRLCDFQYLPLVADESETKESSTESVYHKILPVQIPDQAWFNKKELKDMEPFLLPVRFSHYDNSHVKFNVEPGDKSEPDPVDEEAPLSSKVALRRRQKKICKIFGRSNNQQISIFANFKDKDVPLKPLDSTVRLAHARSLEEQIAKVKQLFEQRPIWTKAAVLFNTGLLPDHSKIVLPMVAYYFTSGPWRISWVKYGYDPRQDPKARIYQTLDYRIRTAESTKLKVNPKRSYTSKSSFNLGPSHVKKISLKDDISAKPRLELDERCYVLRPFTIPPARQMFYQICDLILPEIQDMICRLPRLPDKKTCDPKNGWLPKKFIEDCREIVNNYVLDAVQKELLEDNKVLQEKVSKEAEQSKEKTTSMEYCNQMLSNIKRGIYKKVDIRLVGPVDRDVDTLEEDVEMINLSDDDDDFTVGDIIQRSIPEKMDNEEDDYEDSISQSSDEGEIDMEAVREINQMIVESSKMTNT